MLRTFALAAAAMLLTVGATPAPIDGTVPCVDQLMDIHGDPVGADLVIFAGGNQWFVMPELLAAFQKAHPEVKHIFYETLPPGLLAQQIENGALRIGEMTLSLHADVYLSGKKRMDVMREKGLVGAPVTYATNELAIMVKAGNPKHITSLADLGRSNVRVSMPNPKTEGIARQIELAYKKAGGDALERTIMVTKVGNGSTRLTQIHHRQTPMWLLDGRADAGPVWLSEALYQERIHSGLAAVRIPAKDNVQAIYLGATVKGAPHADAAQAFVNFLATPTAEAIYRSYGFASPKSTEE